MLQAGVSEVCITPPVGVELAGYGPRLKRYSTDVHDQLAAQALVLDDGQTRIALVTCDVIALSPELVAQVRQAVYKRAGIKPEAIMLSCSHSHTAPTAQAFRDWGAPDRAYVRMLARILAGAVGAAAGKLQQVVLRVGREQYPDLAWNRTGSELVDPTVEVVQLVADTGGPLAILTHYACHPVMLGPKTVISADYPGALRVFLKTHYPDAVILFANGACGDIDPASNREVWGQATFDDVRRAGEGLGRAALLALEQATVVENPTIETRRSKLRLDLAVPGLDEIRERIAVYQLEARTLGRHTEEFKAPSGEVKMPRFWLRYYRALERRVLEGKQPDYYEAELQAFLFGDQLALLGIPAEVYTEQGMAIRRQSRYAHTLPVCYANGLYGYLPPREEFVKGGYTAKLAAAVYDTPPYVSVVAERLVSAAATLLH
ncbi:MAG: hypothetical protein DIU68_015335 [Chloroflexota bacterium]|nr:MAG: hypothetical protein DIU68_16520 [Chloroflexota bacterium]